MILKIEHHIQDYKVRGDNHIGFFFSFVYIFLIDAYSPFTLRIHPCSVLFIRSYTVISYRTQSLSNNIGFGIYLESLSIN